jgi:hypothetical protein
MDDKAVTVHGRTLEEVLAAARQRLEDEGKVIVEVEMDGKALAGDELAAKMTTEVDDGVEVRLYSADPRELAAATLQQGIARLEEARQAQREAVLLLRDNKLDEAMTQIKRAVDIWHMSQKAVLHSSVLVGIELENEKFEDRPVMESTQALLRQITSLRNHIQSGDTAALMDSLTYDWPGMIDHWQRLMQSLVGWIDRAGA